MIDYCPQCYVSLVGDPIPQELIDKGGYKPGSHWRREIAIIENDRTVAYKCPDCGHVWDRLLRTVARGKG